MKQQELTNVTYNIVDGTKVVQPINNQLLVDERGRKRSMREIMEVLSTTAYDKRAKSFTIDASEEAEVEVVEKEVLFTAKERYNAKKDYNEFKTNNPEEFNKQHRKFKSELIDKFKNRLRFNLTSLTNLN